jgi:hypothetical protein
MADPQRSQAEPDGTVFGYLGVKISEGAVWTSEHGTPSRYLGPLPGAKAGLDEPRQSWFGALMSSLLVGSAPTKNPTLYVAFADGSRYERMPLPWVSGLDWPKIAGEIGRFNAATRR